MRIGAETVSTAGYLLKTLCCYLLAGALTRRQALLPVCADLVTNDIPYVISRIAGGTLDGDLVEQRNILTSIRPMLGADAANVNA